MLDRICLVSVAFAVAAVQPSLATEPIPVPDDETVTVAVLLADGAQVIDFTGPWEVFQDVHVGSGSDRRMPFRLYTVAETKDPVRATGGLRVVPDHTFADAPPADVIVVPALRPSPGLYEWLRKAAAEADVTMSVCTGASILAAAGLLDGDDATTHHDFVERLAASYPNVTFLSDRRWVDNGRVATAAGLTSGMDLALHIVARYFGDTVAEETAAYMEHDSEGWRGETQYADVPIGESADGPRLALGGLDPVALVEGREVTGRADLVAERGRFVYRFADEASRATFAGDPERFAIQLDGACAAMPGSAGADPSLYLVHDERIFIFGSTSCREHFAERPAKYLGG